MNGSLGSILRSHWMREDETRPLALMCNIQFCFTTQLRGNLSADG